MTARAPSSREKAPLEILRLEYPLVASEQAELIQLWRTEWKRTDYDWVDALNGDYSSDLTLTTFLGRVDQQAAATATLLHARREPDIALLSSVVTDPNHRGKGFGGRVVDAAIEAAINAGCHVCYLGSSARPPHNVYVRHGFSPYAGNVMRRDMTEKNADFEQRRFAPNQKTTLRSANWGDLPGVACLLAQPLSCVVIDFPRGLLSARWAPPQRCVSGFTVVWYDVASRNGSMAVLAGESEHRIMGFGTITPGVGSTRKHAATLEFAAHDHYQAENRQLVCWLVEQARRQEISILHAYVAQTDRHKTEMLCEEGFRSVAVVARQLRFDGHEMDVVLMEKKLDRL